MERTSSLPIKHVVIAGGGTAGWMTAALMRKVLPQSINITLIESADIGIVGVGEATIPPIQTFNQFLGIDEREFLKATKGSIKLAIQFENWRTIGSSYFHTFGAPGTNVGFSAFQHYWIKAKQCGLPHSLWDFDLNYLCCQQGVFNKIQTQNPIYDMPYAYHFDSALYGQFLRTLAEKAGVRRIEGTIQYVQQSAENGHITGLQLTDGTQIQGDFFVDCTGTRSLLLQQSLNVKYDDWRHWLPADSAIAVPSEKSPLIPPYTRSTAHAVGWQWRIPLTHRNGNGIVYSSGYISDDEALNQLKSNLHEPLLDEPRKITFKTGRAEQQWVKNVVAIGLSSGFLEPLESTSIHLIQSGIVRLLKMFPHQAIHPSVVDMYNAESKAEFETVRDFIILHYYLNERDDSAFWKDMRELHIPTRLAQKIESFQATAAVFNDTNDIFRDASWVQVMMGQGIEPTDYHPSADAVPEGELMAMMEKIKHAKAQPLASMLPHDKFLSQYVG